MINYFTSSSRTTSSYTWVDAFHVYTCFIWITFRADSTFWTAWWWCTNVIWQTRTHCMIICVSTLAIRTTRWWIAWVTWYRDILWNWSTNCERISWIFGWAWTNRDVIHYVTICTLSASSNTWIATFISHACLVSRAFCIQDTFWTTILIGVSCIFWQALAIPISFADCIWSARRWITRIRC